MRRFLLLLAVAALPMFSHAIEEPDYEVIRSFGNVELRQYAFYVVAEAVLDTSAEEAGSQAFPILAGHIFGKNKGTKTFAMTAPVTQTAAPTRLDMTAPVTQAAVAGGMRVQFVLPKELMLATAPEPIDSRVQLRVVPAGPWAVIRYSGTGSRSNNSEHLSELKAALYAPRREVMTGGRYGGFCPCISPRCSSSAGLAWAPPPDRLSTRQQRTTKSSGPRRSRVSS